MSSDQSVRILIADNHAIFRAALRKVLESEPGFHVVGEAGDVEDAVALTKQLQPDILLVKLALPGILGVEAVRELNTQGAPWRIILMSAAAVNAELADALHIGARAIIKKDSSVRVLFQCIRAVLNGECWVGTKGVVDPAEFRLAGAPAGSGKLTGNFGLTRRELQVIGAVLAGYGNREIAQRLGISRDTTKHHLSNIFDKLGVSNRLELALFASHHRIGDASSGAHCQESHADALRIAPTWHRAG
jgi:DNA-binding NarL/FixJ family response regulator